MIDLYTYRTSNGRKVSIMLEECGLPYRTHVVDITRGEQHSRRFMRVSPNGRIPAIVDSDGPGGGALRLFESGAILLYLAEKTGRFLPSDFEGRWRAIEWLMWQMGGVGPNFGQAFHFRHQLPDGAPGEDVAYGRKRYGDEVLRLCGVLDRRLDGSAYVAGPEYGVADMAIFPWIALHGWLDIDLGRFACLREWYRRIGERTAVRRGMDVPSRRDIERRAPDPARSLQTGRRQ